MEAARSAPEFGAALRERFATFMRGEIAAIAARATKAGDPRLSEIELDHVADTAVALLAYRSGSKAGPLTPERLSMLVDHVLVVLVKGHRPTRSDL